MWFPEWKSPWTIVSGYLLTHSFALSWLNCGYLSCKTWNISITRGSSKTMYVSSSESKIRVKMLTNAKIYLIVQLSSSKEGRLPWSVSGLYIPPISPLWYSWSISWYCSRLTCGSSSWICWSSQLSYLDLSQMVRILQWSSCPSKTLHAERICSSDKVLHRLLTLLLWGQNFSNH